MVFKMSVSYTLKDGFLIIKSKRKYLVKTKTRDLPIESLLQQLPEEVRSESATAIALALFRARRHDIIFDRVRGALFEPSKRLVVLSIAKYYIMVASLFGKDITTRVAKLMRTVLFILP